jgi:murein DD-endopeptidase MepM/ murein hydrolase activator NlpD
MPIIIGAIGAAMLSLLTIMGLGVLAAATMPEQCAPVSAGVDTGVVPVAQGDTGNVKYVWTSLRAAGLNEVGAASVMGNLMAESGDGIDPEAGREREGPKGIAQWLDQGGRWNTEVIPWAKKKGLDKWALETQVSFLLWEMRKYPGAGKAKNLLTYFAGVTDVAAATKFFKLGYEGCAPCTLPDRIDHANSILARFKDEPVTPVMAGIVPATVPLVSASAGKRVWPVGKSAGLSAYFHQPGSAWSSGFHTGQDFSVGSGVKIHAAHDGKVVASGWNGPYGESIDIQGKDGSRTIVTRYSHQSKRYAMKGTSVKAGDVIGLVGSTGNSSGPHLHFELLVEGKQVDPLPWLKNGAIDVPGGDPVQSVSQPEECEDEGSFEGGTGVPNPNAGPEGGAILGTYPGLGNVSAPIRRFTNAAHEKYASGNTHSCTYGNQCMDLGTGLNEPIYAFADGRLTPYPWSSAQSAPGMGYGIKATIKHKDGSTSMYAHLSSTVGPAREVKAGELIALAGCTTGSRRANVSCSADGGYIHLHWEWSGLPVKPGGANPPFFLQWQTKCYEGVCDAEGSGRLKDQH